MYGVSTKSLTIGIDFDDTITTHPEMFKEIINIFKKYGCIVYIVTARSSDMDNKDIMEYEELVDDIIFAGTTAKHKVAFDVDIWIDDFPLSITHSFNRFGYVPEGKYRVWVED